MDAQAGATQESRAAVELAVRDSYGRLLAYLAARTRDIAAAEDALADALVRALEQWPVHGVPESPEAWLLTAARRGLVDRFRRQAAHSRAEPALRHLVEASKQDLANPDESTMSGLPDERLPLMLLCCHPAIDPTIRAPLILQTVLGLDAARVGSAYLVAPKTMGQRLSRAKTKIRDAAIPFELPPAERLAERLPDLLEAVYAAYGIGWEAAGADDPSSELAAEAIWLARLLARLLPDEPECLGLLALVLHCDARRRARRDADGRFVPLDRQETDQWCRERIYEAERTLTAASRAADRRGGQARFGRFQLEAAIQSAHAKRLVSGRTDWRTIALLYSGLIRYAPSAGAYVGHAAAIAEIHGPRAGLNHLERLAARLEDYQPYWAVRAALKQRLGREGAAREAYGRAIALTREPAVRAYLEQLRDAVRIRRVP